MNAIVQHGQVTFLAYFCQPFSEPWQGNSTYHGTLKKYPWRLRSKTGK